MNQRPVVLLDCDGVLADFVGAVLDLVHESTGKRHALEEIKTWHIFDSIGNARLREHAWRRVASPGFCRSIKPLPEAQGAVLALQRIADVVVVTAPWAGSASWMAERTVWLKEHFNVSSDNVIHAARKELTRGDYFLDDKPINVRLWREHHNDRYLGVGLVWDTPHNRSDPADASLPRVHTWEEFFVQVEGGLRFKPADEAQITQTECQLLGVSATQRQLIERMQMYTPLARQALTQEDVLSLMEKHGGPARAK